LRRSRCRSGQNCGFVQSLPFKSLSTFHQPIHKISPSLHPLFSSFIPTVIMPYFRITLLRSAIGLPKPTTGVLKALGLHKRFATVYYPVSQQIAGQIFAVKELVDVQEVERKFSKKQLKELRRPDTGFYVEKKASEGIA